VVCLAPQAQEEIVRLRRLSGVVVRPLNFTVRFLRNRFRKPLPDEVYVATITHAHHLGSGQAR